MNATAVERVKAVAASVTERSGELDPPGPWDKPAPGSWQLDASHCERPLPRFMDGIYEDAFGRGFREGLAGYGVLLETIEAAVVNGFIYTCVRPLGAPPEAKGPPPKALFKLLTWLHPEVRRRLRRAEEALAEKLWRAEAEAYLHEWMPPLERRIEALSARDLAAMSDGELAEHLVACRDLIIDGTAVHFRVNCSRILPVGDFMAHVVAWTGAGTAEVLEAMRGVSPSSREGLDELHALADALRGDEPFVRRLGADDPGALLEALEGRQDAAGEAARAWLAIVGGRLTGYSPCYPSLRERPQMLVESLRGALDGDRADDSVRDGDEKAGKLRERVPAEHRATFDELLEEARHVYFIRDHSCMVGIAELSVARRALLEAGRRLLAADLTDEADAAFDLTVEELMAMLGGKQGPAREEIAARGRWRRTATCEDAPETLGPAPGSPPPDEWLPPAAARIARAMNIYVTGMFGEHQDEQNGVEVRGVPASGGKRRGVARVILRSEDFDRVREGDVLVARVTTPAYNVLLPLLAGIVTDRGGLLSHPAIVSREYGIPGVVGTRSATRDIADGAQVEIDGDEGVVRVIA